jgi:hypothetical protein
LAADAADRKTATGKPQTALEPEKLGLNAPAIWSDSDDRSEAQTSSSVDSRDTHRIIEEATIAPPSRSTYNRHHTFLSANSLC